MYTESDDGNGTVGMIPIHYIPLPDEARSSSLTPPANGGPTYPKYCTLNGILTGIETFTNQILSSTKTIIQQTIDTKEFTYQHDIQDLATLDNSVKKIKQAAQNTTLDTTIALVLDKKLMEEGQKLQASEAQLQNLKSLLSSLDDTYISCFKQSYQAPNSGTTIDRFGIIPSTTHIGLDLNLLKLHPLERVLYELAQNYFVSFSKPIVLMDVFARKDGCIKEDPKHPGLPETHTIVLWKPTTPNNTTTYIIDPNQRSYSEFLTNALSTTTLPLVCAFTADSFYSDKYIPTGSGRDCIDIALKISFELAATTSPPTTDTDRMILDKLYKKFSNAEARKEHPILRSIPAIHSSDENQKNIANEILTQAETFLVSANFKIVKTK